MESSVIQLLTALRGAIPFISGGATELVEWVVERVEAALRENRTIRPEEFKEFYGKIDEIREKLHSDTE